MTDAHVEVERKFRVHPPFQVPDLSGIDGVAAAGEPEARRLAATYVDTADLRLAREGITLRYRTGGKDDGWHLKLPLAAAGEREELHRVGEPDQVPDELRALVRAYVRFAALEPVATLLTERSARLLCDDGGRPLAEVVDDTVSVLNGTHVAARFREIEVEDLGGGAGVLEATSTALRAAGAVAGEFVPKVVRALGPRATGAPDPPPPAPLGPGDPARAVVEAYLRRHVRALVAQDVRVRRRQDDSVHQMRVATRRLRSGLRTFRPLLDRDWADALRAELRWLGQALADARDNEVLLARLESALDDLPVEAVRGPVHARIQEAVGGRLTEAQHEVVADLDSDRYLSLVDRLVAAAWEPATLPTADAPGAEALPPLVGSAWRRLARSAARLRADDPDPGHYHLVRIAAKRARYAAEAVAPALGRPARRFAAGMEQVQEVLGEHQDAVVAADVLQRLASRPRAGAAAFTLGVLYQRQLAAAADARARFHAVWPDVSRRRYRRWLGG